MRRFWSIGGFSLLAISSGLWLSASSPREPIYAGKTLDQWLDAGYEDGAMALQGMGPAAVPYVLAKLAREDPRSGSQRAYQELWRKIPPTLRKIVPKPKATNFDELRACSALLEIGPQAVPLLSRELENPNAVVREASAHAMGCFGERGHAIRSALPGLGQALHDPDRQVRMRAAWAIGAGRLRLRSNSPGAASS